MDTATYQIDGHTMREHWMTVPLDYFGALSLLPSGTDYRMVPSRINVFAREYIRHGHEDAPRLVFFQGGPGSAAPRMAPIGSWLDTALEHFRVVLIDERGTGNSHPLEQIAITSAGAPEVQAAYLSCFRQDSIVRDAEILRQELQGDTPWAALGQSFGGFTVTCYLSQAPQGLSEAFITAGLPSTTKHADEVYRLTYRAVSTRNREFFARYPHDETTSWYVATHLADVEETLPTGERLTPGRFRQLGIVLGYSYGPEQLHFLLEDPVWSIRGQRRLRPQFLSRVGHLLSFADNPLYAVLHEAIYAQSSTGATAWSAQRVRGEFPEFALPELQYGGSAENDMRKEGRGFRFTGEHIFPWQIEQDPALKPLAAAGEQLAFSRRWPELYSPDTLAENTVPTAAWIYLDDAFVPYELSKQTADQIRGLKPLITNDYHHDGLRTGGPQMIERLLGAVRS
ncbi:alpha/beta fold hydrolase [Actinomycetaceae bacterium L2_0104]